MCMTRQSSFPYDLPAPILEWMNQRLVPVNCYVLLVFSSLGGYVCNQTSTSERDFVLWTNRSFCVQTKYSTLFENCWSSFSVLGQRAAEKQSFSNAFSTTAKLFSRIRLVHFYHWLVSLFLGGIRFCLGVKNEKPLSLVRFPSQLWKAVLFPCCLCEESLVSVLDSSRFFGDTLPTFIKHENLLAWKDRFGQAPRGSLLKFWKSFCRSPYSVLEYGPLFGDICNSWMNRRIEFSVFCSSFSSSVKAFLLIRSLKERGRKRLFSDSVFVQVAAFGSRSWPLFWRYLHRYCAENRSDS